MNEPRSPDITLLLAALHRGEPDAEGALLKQVYAELRQLARAKMAREQPGHTLQPTALVHEAWLRLNCGGASGEQRFANRAHFFGAAAEAMRRILVDRARSKRREKRGAGAEHVDADDIEIAMPSDADKCLFVHEALDALAAEDPVKADIVKLHFFVGLKHEEIADALGLHIKAVRRHWAVAKVRLFGLISGDSGSRQSNDAAQ